MESNRVHLRARVRVSVCAHVRLVWALSFCVMVLTQQRRCGGQ